MVQLVPFQRSASVNTSVVPSKAPTAMQAVTAVQDTPFRVSMNDPGLGVGKMVQLVPFHDSASVKFSSPVESVALPTPMQADGLTQDTGPKAASAAPAGLGLGCTCHLVPSQRSLSVTMIRVGECAKWSPVAMHADALKHATPPSAPLFPGFGVVRMRHLVPFHCSDRVIWLSFEPLKP